MTNTAPLIVFSLLFLWGGFSFPFLSSTSHIMRKNPIGFSTSFPPTAWKISSKCNSRRLLFIPMASINLEAMNDNADNDPDNITDDDSSEMNDEALIHKVSKSQFQNLCRQLNLSTKGSKQDMLMRLRKHADEQAALERTRRMNLKKRVEEGANEDERERHEIIGGKTTDWYDGPDWQGDENDEKEEDGYFYFELPSPKKNSKNNNDTVATESESSVATESTNTITKTKEPTKMRPFRTQGDVIAPPPPPPDTAKVNEKGERVVTVYSTTDHNDLTGIAAAQPGQAAMSGTDPMAAGSARNEPKPWDMDSNGARQTKAATSKELEQAKDKVNELVQMLLAMSGAPAFRDFEIPEELEDISAAVDDGEPHYATSSPHNGQQQQPQSTQKAFVGFDPTKVPTHVLADASQALRANRGQVLQDVLREFELLAIGQDGMAGDKMDDGGGHFREVSKVRAFLEGYRRAEVRKAARATVTFLLDKLVSEGIDGLDFSLSTMSRSNDDSASEVDAYELNDSLLDYLNDVIREQERKVNLLVPTNQIAQKSNDISVAANNDDDPVAKLWNQTKGENGETIESIDPNDPKVQRVLKEEIEKSEAREGIVSGLRKPIPETAPEKLLLLLTLLRERIKTEAAFANDERSRYLRLLAYCLQCDSEVDREELIMKELGSSIDRLDSFLELVASSIEYAESTSYQLQPAKRMPLNVKLLKSIADLAKRIREQQAWKASGLRP